MADNATAKFTVELGGNETVVTASERVFSTGSRGYQAQGKHEANGKRYQVNLMLVEIGSKAAKGKGK